MKHRILLAFCIGTTALISSCHSTANDPNDNLGKIEPLSYIGNKHNEMLDTFFSNVRNARSGTLDWQSEYNKTFSPTMEVVIVAGLDDIETSRSITGSSEPTNEATLTRAMVAHNAVVPEAEPLLCALEEMLRNPPDSRAEVESFFAAIEQRSQTLPQAAKEQVTAYLETAQASLVYWYDNIDQLSAEFLGLTLTSDDERATFDSAKLKAWWLENKKKIGMCIASDAAGAAVGALTAGTAGAVTGMVTAAGMPVIAGSAAAIGAVITGAASSIQGFMNEKFVVVIPDFLKQAVQPPTRTTVTEGEKTALNSK